MRRVLTGLFVAAAIFTGPALRAGNQETADQIKQNLEQSGKMSGYRIAIAFQDGVARLKGQVTSREQMNMALRIAYQTDGVNRVVNELAVAPDQAVQQVSAEEPKSLPAARKPVANYVRPAAMNQPVPTNGQMAPNAPRPMYAAPVPAGAAPMTYDQPCMPNYAWPSYAAYPNYAGVTYPKQYSPTAWPYIGPFYPYPQVPLGWRKVTLEWDDGWWFLDFKDEPSKGWHW